MSCLCWDQEQCIFHTGVRIGLYSILAIKSDLYCLLGLGVVHTPCQGLEWFIFHTEGRSGSYSIPRVGVVHIPY